MTLTKKAFALRNSENSRDPGWYGSADYPPLRLYLCLHVDGHRVAPLGQALNRR